MSFELIDLENWARRPYFEHYLNAVPCEYSMTVSMDIIRLRKVLQERKLKLYPVELYLLALVVNRYPQFRTSLSADGKPGIWSDMHPSYTIFHPETETFSSIWTHWQPSFTRFYQDCLTDMETYRHASGFTPKPDEPANCFPVSAIPWVSFTGFNLNLHTEGRWLLPIFTSGRFEETDGKWKLPFSVQVHHAVCDGYHVGRFVALLQEALFRFGDEAGSD